MYPSLGTPVLQQQLCPGDFYIFHQLYPLPFSFFFLLHLDTFCYVAFL